MKKKREIREKIEEKIGLKLLDFPDTDYEKIEKSLKENGKIEVWLMKGMGRYYLVSIVGENAYSFPIQEKLCDLSL